MDAEADTGNNTLDETVMNTTINIKGSSMEKHNELVHEISIAMKRQEVVKGNVSVLYFTGMSLGLLLVGTLMIRGVGYFIPMLLALIPAPLFVYCLWRGVHDKGLSTTVILEFAWLGGIVSVLTGCLMEMGALFIGGTYGAYCNLEDNSSLSCDLYFVLMSILGVGVSEELAKLVPVLRVFTTNGTIPFRVRWWHRYVDNPAHLVIMAVSTAGGFAAVENLKYVFVFRGSRNVLERIQIAIFRGFLSIPLHVACTGILGCSLANHLFKSKDGKWEERGITSGKLCKYLIIPSILHGLYDAFIFLSMKGAPSIGQSSSQPHNDTRPIDDWPSLNFLGIHELMSINDMPDVDVISASDIIWAHFCLSVTLLSFISALVCFGIMWKGIKNFEKRELPMILRNRLENGTCVFYPTTLLTSGPVEPLINRNDV